MLFYGTQGAGKTELAGTVVDVPTMCNAFMISAEKGEMTIQETDRIINKDGIFIARIDDITACEQIRQWLQAHCKYRDEDNESELKRLEAMVDMDNDGPAKRFNTVIIDTLTEIQAFAMYQTLGMSRSIAIDADLPDQEWSHFNKILNRMQLLARAFRDLPLHVIYLCQETYIQDETKKKLYSPMLAGQMSKKIQGFVDMCGYLTIVKGDKGDDVRRLWVQPVGPFNAKNRMAAFKGAYIDDPTIAKIVSAIGMVRSGPSKAAT